MMGSDEIKALHKVNESLSAVMDNFKNLTEAISVLTQMIYDREIAQLEDIKLDGEFKPISHM